MPTASLHLAWLRRGEMLEGGIGNSEEFAAYTNRGGDQGSPPQKATLKPLERSRPANLLDLL
jgi:hypothetical protein